MDKLFEYRSLVPLINEIIGKLPRLNDKYSLNRDSAIEWAIDCLKGIGHQATQEKFYHVQVSDNITKLPSDIFTIEGVFMSKDCDPISVPWPNSHLYPLQLRGGITSNNRCTDKTINNSSCRFSVSINYPYAVFNFTDEWIIVDYKGFPVDDDKIPMYPDIPLVRKAIESYIIWMWMYEPYLLKEFDANSYLKLEHDKVNFMRQARLELGFFSKSEARNLIEGANNRYKNFKIPRH